MFGNVATIGLTNAPVTLTTPPNSGATWSGPYQSQSALIRFTGTLTASCVVTFPAPGFYIVENLCTVGAFYVQLTGGGGEVVCAPPGKQQHVFNDGTNVRYVNMPEAGEYKQWAISALPAWVTNCTVPPWLICDGSIYNISAYPALGALLGSTFGGNGVSTFGVPDARGRILLPIDSTNARVTSGVSGIAGNTIASVGGSQSMQAHNHGTSDPGHSHQTATTSVTVGAGSTSAQSGVTQTGLVNGPVNITTLVTGLSVTGITITSTGAGGSQNMPPTLVAGLCVIKT